MPRDSTEDRILRRNRALRQMLDLARRVIADGVVTEAEAAVFRGWLERHPDMEGVWPCDILVRRFHRIFREGEIDDAELADLRSELADITGEGLGDRGEFGRLNVERDEKEDEEPGSEGGSRA